MYSTVPDVTGTTEMPREEETLIAWKKSYINPKKSIYYQSRTIAIMLTNNSTFILKRFNIYKI
jgi:hypothetical protein